MTALSIRGFSVMNGVATPGYFALPMPPGPDLQAEDTVLFAYDLTASIDVTGVYNQTAVASKPNGPTFYIFQADGTNRSSHNILFVWGAGPAG